jgi:hypothetical protein
LAELAGALAPEQLDAVCKAITELPDRSFLDVSPNLLNAVQTLYFTGNDIEAQLPKIRSARGNGVTTSAGRPVGSRCTLDTPSHPFSSVITPWEATAAPSSGLTTSAARSHSSRALRVVAAGPTLFVASLALNLLEVESDPRLLPFAVDMADALLAAHPNDTALWTDYTVGQRWCRWLDAVLAADPSAFPAGVPLTARIHTVLGRLANVGIPEAAALERKLPA